MELNNTEVVMIIHQIGSGADGGLKSISEIIANTRDVKKIIVTNIETPMTRRWREHAEVLVWPMVESDYRGGDRVRFRRVRQTGARLATNLRLWRLLRNRKVRLVHANDHRSFLSAVLGAKAAGAPIILNVRDAMRTGARKGYWSAMLRFCDHFLVLSRDMQETWKRDLAPFSLQPAQERKFSYIYSIVNRSVFHPVSPGERAAVRARLNVDPDRPALVYVGRFDDKKAQLDFIRASLPLIARRAPDVLTYFIGDFEPDRDAYAAACAEAVTSAGLEHQVRFVGYSDAVADWYRAADIVVLASKREGLPRCMIESLACGAAFISFDVSSTREILEDHDCGIVVGQGEYEALADEVVGLLGDPERLEKFRSRGPAIVADLFDAGRNGGRYSEFVRDASGKAGRA